MSITISVTQCNSLFEINQSIATSPSVLHTFATFLQRAQLNRRLLVLQRRFGIFEKWPQWWLWRRSNRQTVHVLPRVVSLAAGQWLELLKECVQIALAPQPRRSPLRNVPLKLVGNFEPLQQRNDALLKVSLLSVGNKSWRLVTSIYSPQR